MKNTVFGELNERIESASSIVITGHISPDGDALGSCIALSLYLKSRGKQAQVIVPNRYPSFFEWLPNIEEVMVMEENKKEAIVKMQKADLIFSVDYNTFGRVSAMKPILEQSKAVKVLIDHHLDPSNTFDLVISEPESSSCALLMYRILTNISSVEAITKDIAICIYVGMMTDTGNFSYNSNDPYIYEVINELVKIGIDKDSIYNRVFNTFTEDRVRLIGHCLSNMVVIEEDKTAYICLTLKDQARFNFRIGDSEGIVNMPLQIEGITKSVMLKEDVDKIKLSFRSQGDEAVNMIAENFGGGGHKNAAGGESYMTMEETVAKLLPLLKK